MNVKSKDGVRKITLDKTERSSLTRTRDIMLELSLGNPAIESVYQEWAHHVFDRVGEDGVFSPSVLQKAKPEPAKGGAK